MSNVYKLPDGLDYQGRYETRRARWAEQDWRNTMQKQPPVPFESIAHLAEMQDRAQQARNLLVWCCVTLTLFCVVALAVAAVVVS